MILRAGSTRRMALVACAAGLIAPAAYAHRSHTVLSTIEWNEQARSLDVTHRLHGHDAEIALAKANLMSPGDDLTQPRTQARLALYVDQRFRLSGSLGPIDLEILAAEMDGAEILLYQTARLEAGPDMITIDNRLLRDAFDDQTNLVNVRLGEGVRTVMFAGSDGAKTVRRRG